MIPKNIFILYATLITLIIPLYSMDNSQITKTYKPNIFARHQQAINMGVSLALAGAAALLTIDYSAENFSDSLQTSLFIAAPVFYGSYFYHTYVKKATLLNSLLYNPESTLDHIQTTRQKMYKEIESRQLDNQTDSTIYIHQTRMIIKKYEAECPVFFLSECDKMLCVFARSINPFLRSTYEKRVSSLLLKKINEDSQKIIHSVHFGCGGALSDLIIITKVLSERPNAQLHIHVIDGEHSPYIAAQDFLNNTHEITKDSHFDFETLFQRYIPYARKKYLNEIKHLSDQQVKKNLANTVICCETKYKQFVTWLGYTFPKASISLSIHSLWNNYLDYIQKHNMPYADVVTTIDIQDDKSTEFAATKDYMMLCKKILQKNPTASNLWLAKNNEGAIALLQYSLKKPAVVLDQINDKNRNNAPIYLGLVEKVATY